MARCRQTEQDRSEGGRRNRERRMTTFTESLADAKDDAI